MCNCISPIVFLASVSVLSAAVMFGAKPGLQAAQSAPKDPGPSATLGAKPPMAGVDDKTVVLFNGKHWSKFTDKDTSKPSGFTVTPDGVGIAGGHDTISKENFGDFQMHVEFMCPVTNLEGQARSNSGVYVHGRYEIQVLDSFGQPPADNLCGGIYKVATPLVAASRPAGEWQTFDITFRAPRFGSDGKVTENPRITVLHNGIVIHNNVEMPSTTAGGIDQTMVKEGPLLLQFHGDPVQYRNIWARRL